MNNKILVELHIPIINKVYEIFLPVGKNVKIITELITKSLNNIDKTSSIIQNMVICDGITGQIIDPNLCIKDTKLQNGSKIILL